MIINIVDKWNWLLELAKAECPDKLMKTALAIAEYVNNQEGNPDYGWAFPDQAKHITPVNGNNESTTSKKITELVDAGWITKKTVKRNGAQVKNLFQLTVGEPFQATTRETSQLHTSDVKAKSGKRAVVQTDKPQLSNQTSGDCLTQQPAVVYPDKVNIDLKHLLETETKTSTLGESPMNESITKDQRSAGGTTFSDTQRVNSALTDIDVVDRNSGHAPVVCSDNRYSYQAREWPLRGISTPNVYVLDGWLKEYQPKAAIVGADW